MMLRESFAGGVMCLLALQSGAAAATVDENLDKKLTMEIRLADKEIIPYQPLAVIVLVTNKTELPVTVSSQYWNDLEFYVRQGEAKETLAAYSYLRCFDAWGTHVIKPGSSEAFIQTLVLTGQNDKWSFIFDHAGEYTLSAKNPGLVAGPAMTAEAAVKVRATPKDEEEATKLAAQVDVARLLQDGAAGNADVKKLEELVKKFPKSKFAAVAHGTLGECYYCRAMDLWTPLKGLITEEARGWARQAIEHIEAVPDDLEGRKTQLLMLQGSLVMNLSPSQEEVKAFRAAMEKHKTTADMLGGGFKDLLANPNLQVK